MRLLHDKSNDLILWPQGDVSEILERIISLILVIDAIFCEIILMWLSLDLIVNIDSGNI